MEIYSQPIHCLEDGRYDPLQCDESNWCRCLQTGSNIPGSDRVRESDIGELKCCKYLYFNEQIVTVMNLLAGSLLVLFSITSSRY